MTGISKKFSLALATVVLAVPTFVFASSSGALKGDLTKEVRHELVMLPVLRAF